MTLQEFELRPEFWQIDLDGNFTLLLFNLLAMEVLQLNSLVPQPYTKGQPHQISDSFLYTETSKKKQTKVLINYISLRK